MQFHFPRRFMRDRVLNDLALGLQRDLTHLAIPDALLDPVLVPFIVEHDPTTFVPALVPVCLNLFDDIEEDLTLLDCNTPLLFDCFNLAGKDNRFCFTTP